MIFTNRHPGATIIVAGCGQSLTNLPTNPGIPTIGVNDVGRHFTPDYLVVVNPPSQFSPIRLQAIVQTRARAVFTQYPDLQPTHAPRIAITLGTYGGTDFTNQNILHYTQNSPYVALCLAIHMGATRIGLIGVDFTDNHFFAATGPHPLASRLHQIDAEYGRLRDACIAGGIRIVNLSQISRLTAFPRESLSTFLQQAKQTAQQTKPLRIVSYATTPVAGVPAILARCIAACTPHRARCVWATNAYGNGVAFDGDIEWSAHPAEADAEITAADILIVHNGKIDDRHRRLIAGKPIITMAHNYAWNVDTQFVDAGMPGLVVAQYQATLPEFAGWTPVANPIPIWEAAYAPSEKGDTITIAYTPSGRHERYPEGHRLYWHGKGYDTTMRILDALAARHRINIASIRDRPLTHAEALAAKRRAHIVIDECVTGSYHRNSLEGLACAATVVNGTGIRPEIADMLRQCADTDTQPFVPATLESLHGVLDGLISRGAPALAQAGERSRAWMERHWDFAGQWRRTWEPAIDRARNAAARPSTPARIVRDTGGVSVVIPHGGLDRVKLLTATLAHLHGVRGIGEVIVAEMAPEPSAADTALHAGAHYLFLPHTGIFNKARTLNAGAALASRELQLWLDNDVILPADFIERACTEMGTFDCLVPWTSVLYLSPEDSAAVMAGERLAAACKPVNTYHSRDGACGAAVLVRTALIRKHGGLDEGFRGWGGEDNAWFHKAGVFGRAAITRKADQLVHHLHHAGSGGYGARAHRDVNPHYEDNVGKLLAMRRVTDPARFTAAFPPVPPAAPWARAEIECLAISGDHDAETRMQAAAAALRAHGLIITCTMLEPGVDPPPDNRVRVAFGAAADCCATEPMTAARCIAVHDGTPPTALRTIEHHVAPAGTASPGWTWHNGIDDLARAILAPLSILLASGVSKRALVAAGTGIGDVLRATPIVRALADQGYAVTMLIAADYPGTAALIADPRWVESVIEVVPCAPGRVPPACSALEAAPEFDVAVFSHLAAPLLPLVRARVVHVFERQEWLDDGDIACFAHAAAALEITEALPLPFAVASARRFDLPEGTVAFHAGCKPRWAFKRWRGFAQLAEQLKHVVVVGTNQDPGVAWPAHVRSFVGLDLPDTAALLGQCAAMVSNDSGPMHLAATIGIPTFGVFGLTSPRREAMPLANMHALTKALPCEPACHAQPLGRHDCPQKLRCMTELTADEVFARILPHLPPASRRSPEPISAPAAPPKKLLVAVRLEGGLGDVILAARFVEGLFLALGHCQIDVFHTSPEAARFVFNRARYVRAVRAASDFRGPATVDITVTTLHIIRYEVRDWKKVDLLAPAAAARLRAATALFLSYKGLFDRRPALDSFWARLAVRQGRDVSTSLDYLAGIDLPTQPMLAPEPAGYDVLRREHAALRGKWMTLHDGFDNNTRIAPGKATKCWPIAHWTALVALLRAAYPDTAMVQLGGPKSRLIPGVDLNLVGRTTLHDAAFILKDAVLHIDGDSGLVHLADAMQTRAVVLFGPTDRAYYGHAGNRNIGPAECGECWWTAPDWLERCPRGLPGPACMESITPEAVLAEVARLPHAIPATALTLRAALYGSDDVSRGAATLAAIFADAGLTPVPISRHAANPVSGVYLHASKQWEYLFVLDQITKLAESNLRIADLGGGRGALAPHLAARGHKVRVFDLDFLWDHGGDQDVERRYMQSTQAGGWEVRFGSIYSLPAADGAFDVAICVSVVEHAQHKDLILRELLRVVRPGGLVVLTFDFAAEPDRFRDSLRLEIFGPHTLDETLSQIGASPAGFSSPDIEASAAAMARDGVLGIPGGMTVGGVALRKAGSVLFCKKEPKNFS